MFIDIWDKENKAIKINKFSKDLINIEKYNDAVNKLVADYGIVLEGDRIKTDYYYIRFESNNSGYFVIPETLYFSTLFDCFTFLISESFEYLFDSEQIKFIEIKAGMMKHFLYENRE